MSSQSWIKDEAGNDTHKLGLLLLGVFLHNRSRWSLLLLFPAGLLVVLMFDHLQNKLALAVKTSKGTGSTWSTSPPPLAWAAFKGLPAVSEVPFCAPT